MSLLTRKTDLKSLKYGQDQPGGGSSGQPYQQVDINKVDTGFNRFRMTKFDDGLVRGGVVGAANASIVDTFRIGKFLKDFPKGPLFIVKQVGLQLSNPQLEHKTNFPTNRPTREQGLLRNVGNFISNTANKILNTVGPTRIYNLGINTLAQVPVNAFGQHIVRHGFTPKRDDGNLYFNVVYHNREGDNNRLIRLSKSILGNTNDIANYIGGPSSIYGIGNTTIRRRGDFIIIDQDVTANGFAVTGSLEKSKDKQRISFNAASDKLRNRSFLGVSTKFMSALAENKFEDDGEAILRKEANQPSSLYDNDWADYKKVNKAADKEANASAKMRVPSAFVGASNYSSSIYSTTTFPKLTLTDDDKFKPSTLNGFTASLKDVSNNLLNNPWVNQVTASADLGVSKQYPPDEKIKIPNSDITTYGTILQTPIPLTVGANNEISLTTTIGVKKEGRTPITSKSYQTYQKIIESRQLGEKKYSFNGKIVNAFGIYGNNAPTRETLGNITPDSLNTPTYSNGKKIVQIGIPWNKVSREERVGSGQQDKINLTPLFENTTGTMGDEVIIEGKPYNINDLVKFRIQSLNYNNPGLGKWMIFRAYLTQFTDNTDAQWNDIEYMGRGDKFYIYSGFSRKISIGFKVAALSAEEMQPMYQKLNYLMGNLMGEYYDNVLRGTLVKMTVGNWIDGQDGILNSLSYTVPQDSPWEIGLKTSFGSIEPLILPHIIEVQMTFTPIGSQTKGINKIPEKNSETSHIAQNYNEIQYATKFSKASSITNNANAVTTN